MESSLFPMSLGFTSARQCSDDMLSVYPEQNLIICQSLLSYTKTERLIFVNQSYVVNALRIWICKCCFPDGGKEAWRCRRIYEPAREDRLNYLDSVVGQTNLDEISTNIGNESYIAFFRQNTAVPYFPTSL